MKKKLLLFLLASLTYTSSALAWNKGGENTGHEWILKKAVELLENYGPSVAKHYPLDAYLPWLIQGARYADDNSLTCEWYVLGSSPVWQGGCDTIHHYGQTGDVVVDSTAFSDHGIPIDFEIPHIAVANNGGFNAIDYADALYEQAKKFWPGGDQPDLAQLLMRDGGSIKIISSTSLGNTWLGGLPFCEKYVSEVIGGDLKPTSACPKWPQWATLDNDNTPIQERYTKAQESTRNAMIYLGWAIHMIQDQTNHDHAQNLTGDGHQGTEDYLDKIISEGGLDHLPTADQYVNRPCGSCSTGGNYWYPVVPYDFNSQWTARQFAEEAQRLAIETRNSSAIAPSFEDYCSDYELVGYAGIVEREADAAIKLVAGLLEKYFSEITYTPDRFEPNNTIFTAKEIGAGYQDTLTLHDVSDEDYYKIHLSSASTNLTIDIFYDTSLPGPGATVSSDDSLYAGLPQMTSSGMRIEMNGQPAGDYYLYIVPFDRMPIEYRLNISIGGGSLPPDYLDVYTGGINTPEKAYHITARCDFTGKLNISKVGESDYYLIDSKSGEMIGAEIEFYPEQGDLQLIMNGKKATDESLLDAGAKKLRIKECGTGTPFLIQITGAVNWYKMCFMPDATDHSCPRQNIPPVANAGPGRTVSKNSVVTLNGSGVDSDNSPSPLSFTWRQTSGPSVNLSGADKPRPTFTASSVAMYAFELVVSDGESQSAPSTVFIEVTEIGVAIPDAITFDEVASGAVINNYYNGVTFSQKGDENENVYAWYADTGQRNGIGLGTAQIKMFDDRDGKVICATFANPQKSVSIDVKLVTSPEGFGKTGAGYLEAHDSAGNTVGTAQTSDLDVWKTLAVAANDIAKACFSAHFTEYPTYGTFDNLRFAPSQVPPPPAIASIVPASGPMTGGTSVTITGTGFRSGAAVTFGGYPATNISVTDTSITVKTPAHAADTVEIAVVNPDNQASSVGYTFDPPPTVTSISPTSGSTGTMVTLTGTGFVDGAAVTFSGQAATSVVTVSSTVMTAVVPEHVVGASEVVVINPNGQAGTLGEAGLPDQAGNLSGGFSYTKPESGSSCGCSSSGAMSDVLFCFMLAAVAAWRRWRKPGGL